MVPTLYYGDRVLVGRLWPRRRRACSRPRGVTVASPDEPALYVKRVVGPSGDTVHSGNDETPRLAVPTRHLFVCGDNRPGSRDSRHWGPLPLHSLRGIVLTKLPGRRIVVRTRLQDGMYVRDVRRTTRSLDDDRLYAERRGYP